MIRCFILHALISLNKKILIYYCIFYAEIMCCEWLRLSMTIREVKKISSCHKQFTITIIWVINNCKKPHFMESQLLNRYYEWNTPPLSVSANNFIFRHLISGMNDSYSIYIISAREWQVLSTDLDVGLKISRCSFCNVTSLTDILIPNIFGISSNFYLVVIKFA